MGKHSQNATAKSFFSRQEKAKAGYGTETVRLGKDSLRPFDYCCLCIQTVTAPVVSPGGFLFCKECIFNNLLTQREKLQQQKVAYEAQVAARAADAERARAASEAAAIKAFEEAEGKVTSGVGADAFSMHREARGPVEGPGAHLIDAAKSAARQDEIRAALRNQVVLGVHELRRKDLARTSYWIPENTPDAGPDDIAKPDPMPRCPCSGAFLKMKQLVDVKFHEAAPDVAPDADAGAGSDVRGRASHVGRYHCPACLKSLQYQQACVLRKCGHVLCAKCTKKFVVPDKRCFDCNTKCKPGKDIINLKAGETAFASHNEVVAKNYRPTMT